MAILKYFPTDFIVKEIKGFEESQTGISVYLLKKRNYTTERAVAQVANSLHIPRKFIGYAGTKDKNAITHQYVSIKGSSKEKITRLTLKDIMLSFIGYSKEELRLGSLKGNSFEIILRDLPENFELNEPSEFKVPNYFDEQRFSDANLDIGLAMLKNEFKKAVELVVETDIDFKERVEAHLVKQPNDFIGALKLLPSKTILFFIHSVQSYFFNEILASKIEGYAVNYSQGQFKFANEYSEIKELPLIGYLMDEYDAVLAKKEITARNFLIRSLPSFSLEGSFRKAFFDVTNFSTKIQDDEEFKGRKKCLFKFDLGSGSYATIVLKSILAKQKIELKELKQTSISD